MILIGTYKKFIRIVLQVLFFILGSICITLSVFGLILNKYSLILPLGIFGIISSVLTIYFRITSHGQIKFKFIIENNDDN